LRGAQRRKSKGRDKGDLRNEYLIVRINATDCNCRSKATPEYTYGGKGSSANKY
jgi:hypothetical protein